MRFGRMLAPRDFAARCRKVCGPSRFFGMILGVSKRRGILGVLDDFRRNPSNYPNGKLAAWGVALAALPNVVMVVGLAITTVGTSLPRSSFVGDLFGWLMIAAIWVSMGTMLLSMVGIYILIP